VSSWRLPTFENEEARDWLNDLIDERDVYFVHNTLEIIVDYPPGEKPECWDCCCALAAAEMVAAALGKPPADFPEEAQGWLDAYGLDVDNEVISLTIKAIERIGTNSCLKDELTADGDTASWQRNLDDLRKRLGLKV
jgi:hypothetical protein